MDYRLLMECYTGSHLYGTNLPDSDIDIRGVCLPSIRDLIHPFQNFEQKEFPGEDKVHYSLKKFFQLAESCNPTIIELLFVPDEKKILTTDKWKIVEENREIFLSQVAKHSFVGYATQQLKRIKLHRSWLLNPPKKEPVRSDYGLKDSPEFGLEKVQVLIHAPVECIKEEWREYALAEKSYHDARDHWNQYENWRKTRNPKRFAIEEKYHYDCKHGMHLYRLLSEAKELLTTKNIILPRPDAKFLLQIRNGILSYDELVETGERFQQEIDSIETDLPKKPNKEKILDLFYRMF